MFRKQEDVPLTLRTPRMSSALQSQSLRIGSQPKIRRINLHARAPMGGISASAERSNSVLTDTELSGTAEIRYFTHAIHSTL